MQPSTADQIAEVADMLRREYRVEGETLAAMLPACRRRLPRALRREADFLAEHEGMARHPKLSRQLDHAGMLRACDALQGHLRGIGRRRRRGDLALAIAGSLAFALLAVLVLLVIVLRWRGFI
ncbi:hypothetical protein HUK65_00125 [Rhodobacteraceae bacterium 2376]|uniref:Uncharacterized protein n=1 Tax=Rhabdonatronobacter sediminivivens TaxID=2743469 RepID=A0A7Z0HVX0_9RHOB|nr:hypothetical protein [Rhabdonatronobacter sediminivivens]NYS23379.1 hypothetical protein [Rhabdonatronobacter sediminivivens]